VVVLLGRGESARSPKRRRRVAAGDVEGPVAGPHTTIAGTRPVGEPLLTLAITNEGGLLALCYRGFLFFLFFFYDFP
jgi:hypothetical protein